MGAMTRVMQRVASPSADRRTLAEPAALGFAPFPIPEPAPETFDDIPVSDATAVVEEPASATTCADEAQDVPVKPQRVRPAAPRPARRAPAAASRTMTYRAGNETTPLRKKQIDPAIVAIHAVQSPICEHYRALRARLMNHASAAAPRILAITSTIPQEGKSVTAVNLAMVMSEGENRRVLLLDADFRRGSVRHMLGLPEGPGLADVVMERAGVLDVVRPTHRPNLKVITAGQVETADLGGLLNRPSLADTLRLLRGHFDDVILDTPPVATVSDACTLAPHCDGVVLVVETGRTPEPLVQETVRALNATGAEILGCVLSRYRSGRRHEYDRYYDYYAHG